MAFYLNLIIVYKAVPESEDHLRCVFSLEPEGRIKELKFEMAVVKMYQLDLIPVFITVFQKINDMLSNFGIRTYELVSSKGETIVLLVLPMIKIVRKILSKVIHVRNTGMFLRATIDYINAANLSNRFFSHQSLETQLRCLCCFNCTV